jgi:hypothetical protein
MGVTANLQKLFSPAGGPLQQLATGASWTNGTTITMAATIPSWVVAGMNVFDVTNGFQIGTVSSIATNVLTLTGAASHSGTSGDILQFGLPPADLTAATAAGCDVRGVVQECILKLAEVNSLMSYLSADVITSGLDSTANTIIGTVTAAL